jgi:hypothetical protein|tara:strand:+ start:519 stop:776 length:258 start_codon:yes stop_codon:yes gene_type:complete
MPNNDDYLSRQLSAVNNAFGIQAVDNNNQVQPNLIDGLDYKALYKVLESEVETVILDPNAPQYVIEWGNRVKAKLFEIVQRQANR